MEQEKSKEKKLELGFSFGEITDMITYQGFSFLIFTFYYTVIRLDVNLITLGFILWSIFNALNDPLLGFLSDKTRTKKFGGGRRRPWINVSLIPLSIIMVLLFTPPLSDERWTFAYFLIIINLFDFLYTMFSLNRTSLFPEVFKDNERRARVNAYRRVLMVLGLIVAFVLPSFFIDDLANVQSLDETRGQYVLTGAVFGILVFLTGLVFIKYGIRESQEELEKAPEPFSLMESLKVTSKNKTFLIFITASTMNWYVFGLLPMVISIYASFVLNVQDPLLISLLLLVVFLCSAPGVFIWMKVNNKIGSRRGFMISTVVWIISFIPMFFITNYWVALIFWCFVGIGLGGSPYFIDLCISNICDEDELATGRRREGSFYGMHALMIRLSTILVVISIGSVLSTNGWEVYDPEVVTPELILGLRALVSIFPIAALLVCLIFLKWYPLKDERVKEIQKIILEKH